MTDIWNRFVDHPDIWTAPLRPSPEDVNHMRNQLLPGSRTLLLGVTRELQPYATIAVDNNLKAVRLNPKLAVFGDWTNLPFESEFDAVIGDGCLNVFQGKPEVFFKQVKKALKTPGRLILRVYTSPEQREELSDVLKAKDQMSFYGFLLRVTNAMANPYIGVQDRCRTVKSVWDHPNLEVYRGSELVYYHPKLSELPPWNDIQFGSTYELSERCPTITWCF